MVGLISGFATNDVFHDMQEPLRHRLVEVVWRGREK